MYSSETHLHLQLSAERAERLYGAGPKTERRHTWLRPRLQIAFMSSRRRPSQQAWTTEPEFKKSPSSRNSLRPSAP